MTLRLSRFAVTDSVARLLVADSTAPLDTISYMMQLERKLFFKGRGHRAVLFAALSNVVVMLTTCGCLPAPAAPVEVYEVKQKTDHLGPMSVFVSSDAIKLVATNGDLTVVARSPTWKVVAFNKPENCALEVPLDNWPHDGLKMFKGNTAVVAGQLSTVYDLLLKTKVFQRERKLTGRYFGTDDPAIFRAAKKKELAGVRVRCAMNIPLSQAQRKVIQGIYSIPYCGGYPLEYATLTTDGAIDFTYRTFGVVKSKVDSTFFAYPSGYKRTDHRFEVFVTNKQKERFKDFLETLTDDKSDDRK